MKFHIVAADIILPTKALDEPFEPKVLVVIKERERAAMPGFGEQ
jgi:hypothetical protein